MSNKVLENQVLAQSATNLTKSGLTEEVWFLNLNIFLKKTAGLSFERDNKTMKLEKVTLNKQSLFNACKVNFRANFSAVYEKPLGTNDEGTESRAEKHFWFNDEQKAMVDKAIDKFISEQVARLTSDKWEIETYLMKYAWNQKRDSYVKQAEVKSILQIDPTLQYTAAKRDLGIATRRLADLEDGRIDGAPNDPFDPRIINARKRLQDIVARFPEIEKRIADGKVLASIAIEANK